MSADHAGNDEAGRSVVVDLRRSDGSRSVLCRHCVVADRPLTRLVGLLGRRSLPDGEGLLLRPSGSVHTWFMRFAIDLVFLDNEDAVLGLRSDLRPWRAAIQRGARAVLELPAGTITRHRARVGDRVELRAVRGGE